MIADDSMPGLQDMDDLSSGGDRSDGGSSHVESEDSEQCLLVNRGEYDARRETGGGSGAALVGDGIGTEELLNQRSIST